MWDGYGRERIECRVGRTLFERWKADGVSCEWIASDYERRAFC